MIEIPGAKFYLVGGCVRDALLGRPNKDLDYIVITNMTFDELATILEKAGMVIFVRKPEFLTLRAKLPRCAIPHKMNCISFRKAIPSLCDCGETGVVDITFPRVDGEYKDGRRPESVSLANSLREDAARRDFTINAMYMGDDGEVIDFFGGQNDLDLKVVRAVGNPFYRIQEDYLRILRAVRFSVQLDFSIEQNLWEEMFSNVGGLRRISADRIREELNGALLANPKRTVELLWHLGQELWNILKEKELSFELTSRGR